VGKSSKTLLIFAAIMAVAFGYGLLQLFSRWLSVEESLPAYSTLRADPIGAKAFYEAAALLPGIQVCQNYHRLSKVEARPNTTLFCLGVEPHGSVAGCPTCSSYPGPDSGAPLPSKNAEMEQEVVEAFERAAATGGRVVLTFLPQPEPPPDVEGQVEEFARKLAGIRGQRSENRDEIQGKEGRKSEKDAEEREPWWAPRTVSLAERWGVAFEYEELPKDPQGAYQPAEAICQVEKDLPKAIPWHTALYFSVLQPHWRTIYARDGNPVLIQRQFGRGSLVLSADSYCLSNEGLAYERQPQLLAWLVGSGTDLVFDEFLKGIEEKPNIMTLARKYRLYGFFFGVGFAALLFIWKNSVSLAAPYPDSALPDGFSYPTQEEVSDGLANLLRRSIPERELLAVCYEEWSKTIARSRKGPRDIADRVRQVVAAELSKPLGDQDLVKTYKTLVRIGKEKTG